MTITACGPLTRPILIQNLQPGEQVIGALLRDAQMIESWISSYVLEHAATVSLTFDPVPQPSLGQNLYDYEAILNAVDQTLSCNAPNFQLLLYFLGNSIRDYLPEGMIPAHITLGMGVITGLQETLEVYHIMRASVEAWELSTPQAGSIFTPKTPTKERAMRRSS